MQASFKKRKACIMKKTMELSVLCDLHACAVIIDDNGEVTTWPKNQCEVMKILQRYRAWCGGGADDDHGMKKKAVPAALSEDPLEWDDSVLESLLNEPWEEILNASIVGADGVDMVIDDDDQRLLVEVDSKLDAVMERIEFLKSAGEYGSIENPPLLLEYHPEQSSILMVPTPGSYGHVKSEIAAIQTPEHEQQSTFFVPATPGRPSGVQYVVETIQSHPCFSEYVSEQHRILDMETTPGFFIEVPMEVTEQRFLGYFREIPEQFDHPQLSSLNWNYDLFSFNSY